MITLFIKPARSPAKRVRAGEEERRSERALPRTAGRDLAKSVTTWAAPVGCGLLFLFLLKFVFFVGIVPSASMEPAIREGSFIFGVRVFGELNLGDAVVFEHEGRLLVKRIAALPGEIVKISGDILTVPERCYYMLGDNAEHSVDSRYWDEPFVPRARIVALLPYD